MKLNGKPVDRWKYRELIDRIVKCKRPMKILFGRIAKTGFPFVKRVRLHRELKKKKCVIVPRSRLKRRRKTQVSDSEDNKIHVPKKQAILKYIENINGKEQETGGQVKFKITRNASEILKNMMNKYFQCVVREVISRKESKFGSKCPRCLQKFTDIQSEMYSNCKDARDSIQTFASDLGRYGNKLNRSKIQMEMNDVKDACKAQQANCKGKLRYHNYDRAMYHLYNKSKNIEEKKIKNDSSYIHPFFHQDSVLSSDRSVSKEIHPFLLHHE